MDAPIHVIEFAQLKTTTSYDMAAAQRARVPATVTFRIEGAPRVSPSAILLEGVLQNAGSAPVKVTIFPVSGDGFYAEPTPACAHRKPLPPGVAAPPMQAPPPPLILELPAHTAVRVIAGVTLDDYDWTPGVPKQIEWSYNFWNDPRPTGIVPIP